ncbi:hypothetical protein [Schumannella luteola]
MIIDRHGYLFQLDESCGAASLSPAEGEVPVWTGTLYPALHVQDAAGSRRTLHADGTPDGAAVRLDFGGEASGSLTLRETDYGVELADLELDLRGLALVDILLGASALTDEQRTRVSDPEFPEWPDFRAGAVCVPSARPAPPASILRRWDLGQATVPLGLFGPALGSPYGAAFPRPVYAAAFGDDRGWFLAGAGEVPDAALTLEMRGTSGALRWRYREDLWAPPTGSRRWPSFARLSWGPTAVAAFDSYFRSFERGRPDASPAAAASAWNSWGDFRRDNFDVPAAVAAAVGLEAEGYVLDDGWETSESSGLPRTDRFPDLHSTADGVRAAGLEVGFWQSVGWIVDLEEAGLGPDDLIPGVDGTPRTANWGMDPRDAAHWALDPSSPRTRAFLERRMRRIIREYRPSVIKLDFGYGLPGPDTGAPRDPAYRGERLGDALYRILADAAREEDPGVMIQLYGIHPLHAQIADLIALDDMGDHGDHAEAEGHRHWSVWAALLGAHGVVVNGSSGYFWDQDGEVVLDTAVLGSPGAVLPLFDERQRPTPRQLARRRAINRWHRTTSRWDPLWLDSELGRIDVQPRVASWGRVEPGGVLAALCLRAESAGRLDDPALASLAHSGDWALVSLDGAGVFEGATAVIPVTSGVLELPRGVSALERWADGAATPVDAGSDGRLVLRSTEADLDAGLEGWVLR